MTHAQDRPPEPEPVKNVAYPDIPMARLSNGLKVLVVTDRKLPQVSVKLAFPVGRTANPASNLSLVGMALQLLREGTEKHTSAEMADLLDFWAIDYDSDLLMEYCLQSVSALEAHLEKALELLSEMVLMPVFPEGELQKLKARWRSLLMSQRSEPDFLVRERAYASLYGEHEYSRVSLPLEHLEATHRDELCGFYPSLFGPSRALILFAGPVEMDYALRLAENWFGDWRDRKLSRNVCSPPQVPPRHRVCLVHRPNSVQSKIVVAGETPPKGHSDNIPFRLANQILGGGASARLFLNLREEKGYTYGAYSQLRDYRHSGIFLAGAAVRADVTVNALREILREMEAMRQAPPEEKELTRAKSEITGAFLRQIQTPGSSGTLELVRRLYDLPEDYFREFIPALEGVTPAKVLEICRCYFEPARTTVTVVADRTCVQEALCPFGEVEVYDTRARRVH